MIKLLVLILIFKLVINAFFVESHFVYLPDILIVSCVAIRFSTLFICNSRIEHDILFLLLSLVFMLFCITTTSLINKTSLFDGVVSLIRTVSPLMILVLFLLLSQRNQDYIVETDRAILYLLVASVVCLSIYGAIFLEEEMNRESLWLGTIFGGVHESSYTLASGALLSFSLYSHKPTIFSFLSFCIFAIFSMAMISFGWGVRTISLVCFLFFSTLAMRRLGVKPVYFFAILFFITVMILITTIGFGVIKNEDIVYATSGRTAMYVERIVFLSNNSISEWLFGHGAGSDLRKSAIWWWEEKGAHNDFLTFLTEHGLLFLISLMLLVYRLFILLDSAEAKVLLVIFLMTSLMSNGYLVRPGAAYTFIFALVLLSTRRSEESRNDIRLFF